MSKREGRHGKNKKVRTHRRDYNHDNAQVDDIIEFEDGFSRIRDAKGRWKKVEEGSEDEIDISDDYDDDDTNKFASAKAVFKLKTYVDTQISDIGGSDGNDYVNSLAFSTSTGILTLGRTGTLANLTVDLDGKYANSSHSHDWVNVHNLTSTTNLDNVLTNGSYRWSGSSPANHPFGGYSNMFVQHDGGQAAQMVWGGSETDSQFAIRRRTSGTWNAWVEFAKSNHTHSGYASSSHIHDKISFDSNSDVQAQDTRTRIQTNSGYLEIGPMNGSWCHLQTDRASFYLNKKMSVDGSIGIYNKHVVIETDGYIDANKIKNVPAAWTAAGGIPYSGGIATIGNGTISQIKFDEQSGGQLGYLTMQHEDAQSGSPTAGYSFHFSSNQPTTNVVLDDGGKFIGNLQGTASGNALVSHTHSYLSLTGKAAASERIN